MALADSVPGVSGGNDCVHFRVFYDQFINSLNKLVSKSSKEEKMEALHFFI